MRRRHLLLAAGAAALAGPAFSQSLTVQRFAPRKRPARFLAAVLHGFGSNGADMAPLVPAFQGYAPDAAFVVPDAPVSMGGGAFSWMSEAERDLPAGRAVQAAAVLNAFLDAELARVGLGPERLLLIGFSQGSNMALNVGLRRAVAPAAIVGFEGARLDAAGLARKDRMPSVLIVRGDRDDRVPADVFDAAKAAIAALGAPVRAEVLSGLGHTIDDRGVKLAGDLLARVAAG